MQHIKARVCALDKKVSKPTLWLQEVVVLALYIKDVQVRLASSFFVNELLYDSFALKLILFSHTCMLPILKRLLRTLNQFCKNYSSNGFWVADILMATVNWQNINCLSRILKKMQINRMCINTRVGWSLQIQYAMLVRVYSH